MSVEAKENLAVVILHYGQPELTNRLKDQLSTSDPDWIERILVLDNHAPLPFPGAWRRLEENIFWAGALDYALRELGRAGFSHVCFLNNDIYFGSTPPYLRRAWARLSRLDKTIGPVGVYSPTTYHNPYHPQMVHRHNMQYRVTPIIDGIAPIFRLECIQAQGGLDFKENPYGYGVDVWTSLTAHRNGWPIIVDHQVVVKHTYHSTAKTVAGFLSLAAEAEKRYLTQRMGPNYMIDIKQLQTLSQDFDTL